jgi:hypothetical protein
MNARQQRPGLLSPLLGVALGIAAFAALGALSGSRRGDEEALALAAGGAALAAVFTAALALWLHLVNTEARRRLGLRAAVHCAGRGLMLAIPFALLALLADAGMGWDCSGIFAPAALAAIAYGMGGEQIRLGGGHLRNALFPGLAALAASGLWVLISMLPEMF